MSEHDPRRGPAGRKDRRRSGQNRSGRARTSRATGQSPSSVRGSDEAVAGSDVSKASPYIDQSTQAQSGGKASEARRVDRRDSRNADVVSDAMRGVAKPRTSGIGFKSVNDMGADRGAGRTSTTTVGERFAARDQKGMKGQKAQKDYKGQRGSALRGVASLKSPRARRYLYAAAGADFLAILFVVSLAVIGVTVMGSGITPLPATIASLWMALNLAPFGYAGTDLSMIPGLPAMGLFAFVAWRVRREVAGPVSIRDVRAMVASFLALPLLFTVIAWLMLWDASSVLRVDTPNLLFALLSTFTLHAGAVVVGMGERLLRALLRRRKLPEWVLGSANLASKFVGWLWISGAVLSLISVGWHFTTAREAYSVTSDAGGAVALTALSLLYLPNVALAASGILMGAPANLGTGEASLFAVSPGTMPPLPILAAMPQSLLSPAFAILLIIPVGLSLWLTRNYVRDRAGERAYAEVVFAAVIAGLMVAALAALLGGEVGIYGWSGVSFWLAGILASVWLAVPGAIVVVAMTGLGRSGRGKDDVETQDDSAGVATETDEAADGDDDDVSDTDGVEDAEAAEAESVDSTPGSDADETAESEEPASDESGEDESVANESDLDESVADESDLDESTEAKDEEEAETKVEANPETTDSSAVGVENEPDPKASESVDE
ncbi:cell division protein PerM [Corynebacterium sp. H78]|uniref:cell division protein PerM n=1 Tax=Corynebacterium sp. H78 TaxID=3133417 RepID=UPI0030B2CDB8